MSGPGGGSGGQDKCTAVKAGASQGSLACLSLSIIIYVAYGYWESLVNEYLPPNTSTQCINLHAFICTRTETIQPLIFQ